MNQTEENMKHVGFFGIFKHSFKTIFTWTKIFTQITLTCILPVTIIFILHMELSHHLFGKIENNSLPFDTNDYNNNNNNNDKNTTALDWLYYWLFEVIYLILLTIFSLLATSTVVFTIASIYTNKEVVFCNVLKAVPKVSKRLFVTFALTYITFFVYTIIGSVVIAIIRALYRRSLLIGSIIMIIFIIIYLVGFLYLTVVWQLASVVTVLENFHGCKAMKKGKFLANGKKKIGMAIVFVLYLFVIGLMIVYFLFVEYGHEVFKWALIWRVLMGILCGLLLLMWFLVVIVTQTFLYLVCKSYHREAIDKLSLSTFLGDYTGETTVRSPKPGDEIQLGRTQVQSDASQQV